MGDEIEVRPGIVTKDADGNIKCVPIFSRIVSLNSFRVVVIFDSLVDHTVGRRERFEIRRSRRSHW